MSGSVRDGQLSPKTLRYLAESVKGRPSCFGLGEWWRWKARKDALAPGSDVEEMAVMAVASDELRGEG